MTGQETNGTGAGAGAGRKASLPKRFYKDVAVKDEGGEAVLLLDGKPVRTPGKAPLALPTRAAAEALTVPGVAHAVNIVGFSGATFTSAPNSGAIFVTLKPFEERAGNPSLSAPAIQQALFKKLSAIQEGLVLVVVVDRRGTRVVGVLADVGAAVLLHLEFVLVGTVHGDGAAGLFGIEGCAHRHGPSMLRSGERRVNAVRRPR